MKIIAITLLMAMSSFIANAQSARSTRLSNGTTVINTTELCKARGFKSYTPLEVHIKAGRIIKITALPNKETPEYFKIACNAVLKPYEGMKVSKAKTRAKQIKIDGTTGATFSSKALQQNVKAALDYYNKQKK